jgi:23S rRNA pseudouridine1911/1915/1917 synthase
MPSEEARLVTLTVADEDAGARLDVLLARLLPELSRSAAHRLIDFGDVRVDGRPVKPRHVAKAGETLTVLLRAPATCDVAPQAIDLDVVYEDGDLIVVNKPAGMVTHPAHGAPAGTLVNALLAHCTDLSGIGGELRPGIVHRLDKDTSGLLVCAKHDAAHRALAAQLADRTMSRRYLALVWGEPDFSERLVDAPLGRHPTVRVMMAVVPDGRAARTRLTVLERYGRAALLAAELETGRTHQVRVHCAHLGHPLVGDPVYGRRRAHTLAVLDADLREVVAALPGQALHATRLTFRHPRDGRSLTFEAPPPPAFEAVRRGLATAAPAKPAPLPPGPAAGSPAAPGAPTAPAASEPDAARGDDPPAA